MVLFCSVRALDSVLLELVWQVLFLTSLTVNVLLWLRLQNSRVSAHSFYLCEICKQKLSMDEKAKVGIESDRFSKHLEYQDL
jgi:hypothetical protein